MYIFCFDWCCKSWVDQNIYNNPRILEPFWWVNLWIVLFHAKNFHLHFWCYFIVQTPSISRYFCSFSVCHSPLPYLNTFVLSGNLVTSLLTPFSRSLTNMLNSTVPTTQACSSVTVSSTLFFVFSQCYTLTLCLFSFFKRLWERSC